MFCLSTVVILFHFVTKNFKVIYSDFGYKKNKITFIINEQWRFLGSRNWGSMFAAAERRDTSTGSKHLASIYQVIAANKLITGGWSKNRNRIIYQTNVRRGLVAQVVGVNRTPIGT